jgi:hypothetical protein
MSSASHHRMAEPESTRTPRSRAPSCLPRPAPFPVRRFRASTARWVQNGQRSTSYGTQGPVGRHVAGRADRSSIHTECIAIRTGYIATWRSVRPPRYPCSTHAYGYMGWHRCRSGRDRGCRHIAARLGWLRLSSGRPRARSDRHSEPLARDLPTRPRGPPALTFWWASAATPLDETEQRRLQCGRMRSLDR